MDFLFYDYFRFCTIGMDVGIESFCLIVVKNSVICGYLCYK